MKGRNIVRHFTEQTAIFFSVTKWMFLSSIVGVMIGTIVTIFLKILQYSEDSRELLPFDYYLLPFSMMLSVWMIRKFAPTAEGHGTEKVIEAIHKVDGKIDVKVIPIKLIATVLSIFSGASVGKEGPGAQIGAGAASYISTLFKFSKHDRKKLVICGISAGFASVFGTPIAGAIFGVEVLIIGVLMYDVLLPSIIAGFAAFTTAQFLGIEYTYYDLRFYQAIDLDFGLIVTVILAGLFFGFVSDMVVTSVSKIHGAIKNIKQSMYLKAFIGGVAIILMAKLFGDEYLGLGLSTIEMSLDPSSADTGDIPWYAFILKTIFTSLSLGAGASGGIVTPIFYIGATSGNFFGHFIGSDHVALFSAIGFVSVLAGTTNAPIAAMIMAVELFGLEMVHYAALSIVISFLITGHRSVFSSQKVAMKKSEMLEVKMGEEIENLNVSLENYEKNKIETIKKRIQEKREKLHKKKNKKLIDE
jgi:H+/Cl- antiporter ClcA